MASLFTRILSGEEPGRVLWSDDRCAALLAPTPIRPGHALVLPRAEVDHWLDLEPALAAHVFASAQMIGRAIMRAYGPAKVGIVCAGLKVRHAHLHLVPIDRPEDLDLARQDPSPDPAELDRAAALLRAEIHRDSSR